MVSLAAIDLSNNYGNGVEVVDQSLATLGGDIHITGNTGSGVFVQHASLAAGPPDWDATTTNDVLVSGNSGPDLWCDGSSRITGKRHFPGTPRVDCPAGTDTNFEP
jgi:hypothetical protein